MLNIESVGYYICICVMIINYFYNQHNRLNKLVTNIAILLLATNYPYIVSIPEYDTLSIVWEAYVIKVLFIVFSIDRYTINNSKLFFKQKHLRIIILLILALFITDVFNQKINLLFYGNFISYLIICFGLSNYPVNQITLKKVISKFALFFGALMVIILLIKFLIHPSFVFRELRLQSIFSTADEDGGFLLFFSVIIYYCTNKKIYRSIILIFVPLLLFFTIGTITSLLSLIVIFIISVIRNFKVSTIMFVIVIVLLSSNLIYSFFLSNIIGSFSFLNGNPSIDGSDNNLLSRIEGIWIPAINYVLKESPFFGFGNKGWTIVSTHSGMSGGYSIGNLYYRSPHNFFIFYLAETGLVGLSIIIYMFYSITKRLIFQIKNRRGKNDFIFSIFLGWIVFFLMSMSANTFNDSGWIVLSVISGVAFCKFKQIKV